MCRVRRLGCLQVTFPPEEVRSLGKPSGTVTFPLEEKGSLVTCCMCSRWSLKIPHHLPPNPQDPVPDSPRDAKERAK